MLRNVSRNIVRSFSTMSDRSNFREIEIPVPWGKIAGKSWGDENGKPWLGLHGWLDNSGSLDLLAKDWPEGHHLVAIDFPGHGFSSHLPDGAMYHYLESSVTIERIRRHFNWDKLSLIGHSMGGGLSACYTGLFPEKVDTLIMIDLVKPVCRPVEKLVSKTRECVEQQLGIEERFRDNLHGKVYKSWEEAFQRLKDGAFTPDNSQEAIQIIAERGIQKTSDGQGWTFSRDMRHRVTSLYGFHEEYFAQLANNISSNHLLIKASESPHYESDETIEKILDVYRNNPKFQYSVVEGNHHLHLNNPERVMPVIVDFLKTSSEETKSSL
eukprot:TRINITY_DN6302_c0_g1_i7.p1 TRINITY_DN6302_c0_g1~~TRINITY_DN6302_c0_g1_i7.p1  ORF type:complete len:325 (-),score=56.57 TRINITY_DN6302_c0_g1_i7:456-1430(-)